MAIIIKCDKCGITAENNHEVTVLPEKPNDYHMLWAFMIAGSGMYLHPENLFDMDAYKPELGALLCRKCSDEYKKYKWQLEDEIRNKNNAFLKQSRNGGENE